MEEKYFAGIDIGSTASKTVVLSQGRLAGAFTLPTGWNGKETARQVYEELERRGYAGHMRCGATGYGRICVEYADKVVTEITCHGRGAWALFQRNCTTVDIGGQDTKLIRIEDGQVKDFLMNDKCAAGTGKFVEVMATRLGVSLEELYALSEKGKPLDISAMCTVFAESEVIGHIGAGEKREDIAAGIVDSAAARVSQQIRRFGVQGDLVLTGGLSLSPYFIRLLSEKTGQKVLSHPFSRYEGALGAALIEAVKKSISM